MKGMNTRNKAAIEPPICDQTGDPATINIQQYTKADDWPLVHDSQTGIASVPMLITIDEIIVVRAMMV